MCKINPRVDFAFKKLFGSEENKDLLMSLINSIISQEEQVVELELNPQRLKERKAAVTMSPYNGLKWQPLHHPQSYNVYFPRLHP